MKKYEDIIFDSMCFLFKLVLIDTLFVMLYDLF